MKGNKFNDDDQDDDEVNDTTFAVETENFFSRDQFAASVCVWYLFGIYFRHEHGVCGGHVAIYVHIL